MAGLPLVTTSSLSRSKSTIVTTMKAKYALFLSTAGMLHAGTPNLDPSLPTKPEPWITPTIDIRTRYEFADVDGFDPSHALTFRERLGLKTASWNGFSAMIEGEFSQAAIDDYHGGAPGADPFNPTNSIIADPETNELNQAIVQYSGNDSVLKIGRQRIIHENAAFIGNVVWRQNEQTFDAISLSNTSIGSTTLNYAYLNQINRIFGSDADAPLSFTSNVQDVDANVHLFHASHTGIGNLTLGSYIYLMDFHDKPNWDNNTFGISAKTSLLGLSLFGELAFQDEAGFLASDEALYAHFSATKAIGTQSFTLGVEHLDAGFKTPLATVHAFNGFADAFIGGRVEGTHNGLTDLYLSHTTPLFAGIKWTNILHAYGDNEFSTGYGWEYNSVLVKKFDDHFTAIAKFSQFESEGEPYVGTLAGLPTTSRFSIELNYTF
jgi:hypothetical protein